MFDILGVTGFLAALVTCVGLPLTVLFLRSQTFPTRWVFAWLSFTVLFGLIRLLCADITALVSMFASAAGNFFAFFATYLLALIVLRQNGWRLADRRGGVQDGTLVGTHEPS